MQTPTLRVLEAAHINDDEYFRHPVNEDIDRIIRDLREKHRKDSRLEKQMILYCKQLQIDYRKLTEEEFRWFIRILKKSKLYKGGGRGKK